MPTAALPTWRDWLFSAKAFLASMLALWIALAAGLSRPYWAMAAVYVVANPLSGATTSKALYRALGTLLGAAGSILLLPPLADTPELFSLAVALWTGGFLFVSLLDRTPRSYVFMLAGYSLPLIALPTVSEPGTIFDVAVARTEEITLGIVCASLVFALVLPVRVGPVLGAQAAAWLRDAGAWAGAILRREGATGATRERQRLAADIRAMDMLISQIAYDAATPVATRQARELRGRMAVLLPILSSLADRLEAVRANGAEPAGLAAVTAGILAWMEAGPEAAPDEVDRLQQALAALEPRGAAARDWDGLVLSSALERLKELVDLWQDCRALQRRITLGHRADRWKPAFRHRRTVGARPHYDFGLLLFSAGSVVLATLAACFVWIATGWDQGAGCVIMTAVGCSFFAALDNPAPQIRSFVIWMGVSVVASAVYLFAILPAVHDFPMLVAVFAVPFLIVGTLVTRPQFTMIAMLLAVNTASFVGLQASYSADFATFANGNIASVAGGLFGLVWSLVTRPFGAAFAARRLVRAGWADIAATARGGANRDPDVFAGRVFDRLGQLVPRLAQTADPDVAAADGLAELRIGMNILDLQRIRPALPAGLHPSLDAVLDGVAAAFGRRVATGRAEPAPESLLRAVDAALAALTEARIGTGERAGLQALVGLRRALFPHAPGPLRLGPLAAALPIAAE
ncbi:FUSC family protein [Labrys wisconsinensis]|uniref:Membrane protein YccC n=1 Tax=Labrys wisconsinensis TaxID=425677 RepID=A0ABU0J1A9_9HYPH|nr:FUSC family protein [Labrys wisconsinensis]MDQ0467415.1 putative membrane protein YccC [Labrys wisconsinensis]